MNTKPWWSDDQYWEEGVSAGGDDVWDPKMEKIILEAEKRILEQAIERLEGKNRCTEKSYDPGSCIACGEAGEGTDDCVNNVIRSCIEELKSLIDKT